MDILVKPMLRLTKYRLLLEAIHKKTDDDIQKDALLQMVSFIQRNRDKIL